SGCAAPSRSSPAAGADLAFRHARCQTARVIPYLDIPTLHLGALEIHAFGVLVAIGILVGANRTQHRAGQLGLPAAPISSMVTYVVVSGFIVGHLFDVLAYQTDALRERSLGRAI